MLYKQAIQIDKYESKLTVSMVWNTGETGDKNGQGFDQKGNLIRFSKKNIKKLCVYVRERAHRVLRFKK